MSPFDPNPRPLEPAQNGFIWCESCGGPKALPHTCPPKGDERPPMFRTLTPEQIDCCLRVGSAEVAANIEYATKRYHPEKGGPALARLREVRAEHAKLFRDVVLERAEFAESLLCALAFDHGRVNGDHSCPTWTDWGTDGHCAFCEAGR